MKKWYPIAGYEGRYYINKSGIIVEKVNKKNRVCARRVARKHTSEGVKVNLDGYLFNVDQLMIDTFFETLCNPNGSPVRTAIYVIHKDGNNCNNALNNLEVCDRYYIASCQKHQLYFGSPIVNFFELITHM